MGDEAGRGAAAGRRMTYARARRMSADQLAAAIALREPLAARSGPEAVAELRMLRTAARYVRDGRPLCYRRSRR
jgi:hypothetical protein